MRRSYPYLFYAVLEALIKHERTAAKDNLEHYRVLVAAPGDKQHMKPNDELTKLLREYLRDVVATHKLPPARLPNGQPHPLAEGLVHLQAGWRVYVARSWPSGELYLHARRPPVQ